MRRNCKWARFRESEVVVSATQHLRKPTFRCACRLLLLNLPLPKPSIRNSKLHELGFLGVRTLVIEPLGCIPEHSGAVPVCCFAAAQFYRTGCAQPPQLDPSCFHDSCRMQVRAAKQGAFVQHHHIRCCSQGSLLACLRPLIRKLARWRSCFAPAFWN